MEDEIKKALKEQAKEVIKAWESLPEGYYSSDTMSTWLSDKMSPMINKLREVVNE